MTPSHKAPLSAFLARNPFPDPLTFGFFYREKMRAIHRIAPDEQFRSILEVGGGRSGMTAMLYPGAHVTNLDMNPEYATAPCNQRDNVSFVCGDATDLPFKDDSFDSATMFDLLEHVENHEQAISEAFRVLRPGGYLLVSSPNTGWRFPYYRVMKGVCPPEEKLFAEWGHVRRGYEISDLEELIGLPCKASATFINPVTVLCHDVSFSDLPRKVRKALCYTLTPIMWLGYAFHRTNTPGTEIASAWQKPL